MPLALRRHEQRQINVEPDQYPGPDLLDRALPVVGQLNPIHRERIEMQHGRYLAGLGAAGLAGNVYQQQQIDPDYSNPLIGRLEKGDDVYGSGIFDPAGAGATVHPELGVFADAPSLPGYVGREEQFSVSPEVADIANGADVVVVPAGGMSYREANGLPAAFFNQGSAPPQPQYFIPPPTNLFNPYVNLSLGDLRMQPDWGPMGWRDTSRVMQEPSALGADEPPSVVTYALVGLAIGAAAGTAVHFLKRRAKPNKRRNRSRR